MRKTDIRLTLLLLTVFGCAHADVEARLVRLEAEADRQAVVRLMHAYAHGIDDLDEARLRATFAEDAVAEYVGVNFPMDLRLEGVDAIIRWLFAAVGDREGAAPWHYMSTELVEVDGDRATLRTFQHNRSLAGVGLYRAEASRTGDGWRITHLRLDERILDEALLDELHNDATRRERLRPPR